MKMEFCSFQAHLLFICRIVQSTCGSPHQPLSLHLFLFFVSETSAHFLDCRHFAASGTSPRFFCSRLHQIASFCISREVGLKLWVSSKCLHPLRMHNEPELTKKKASRLLLYGSHLLLHILISILLLVGDGLMLQNANLYNQIQTMVNMNCDVVEVGFYPLQKWRFLQYFFHENL